MHIVGTIQVLVLFIGYETTTFTYLLHIYSYSSHPPLSLKY